MGKTKKDRGSQQLGTSSSVDDKVDLIQLLSNNSTTPSEDEIISVLQARFKNDLPYTRLSSTSLVVVNPNKNLSCMNDASAKEYADQWYKDTSGNKSALQPHVYELAAKVYMHMRRTAEDQSVIFSGITGSGKTATQGHLLQQLLLLSTHTKKESKIANQIQNAQIILEAFGNSKTLQNINASRFGKYLELQFNERGRVVGAKTLTYCFDKSRVTDIPSDERTYHVFYYLLAGATPEERSQFNLLDSHQYHYLSKSKCYKIPDVDDSIQMDDLRASLKILGFKSRTIGHIWQILSAILLLGNIDFISHGKAKDEAASIRNHNVLDLVAQHLGVSSSKLEQTLTYKTKCIGKELCTVFLNAEAAMEQRDALARALYSILFTWIVEHINSKLIHSDEPPNFIGLLDQPGYQNFKKNSFEQFCLNFATEEIENFVLKQIFDDSIGMNNEIIQDGVSLPNVTTMDNNGCLELLRGDKSDNVARNSSSSSGSVKISRGGLISVLDTECAKVQNGEEISDDSKLLSTLQNTFSDHLSFISNPSNSKISSKSGAFGINHFAGSVTYTIDQFIDKNLDTLGPDFINLFSDTNNSFIKKLFNGPALAIESHPKNERTVVKAQLPTKPMRAPSMKRKKSNAGGLSSDKGGEKVPEETDQNNSKKNHIHVTTVTTQLFSTLNQLTDTLKETRLWNVFQIRPNDANQPDLFDVKRVYSQVRSFLIRDIISRKLIEYIAQYSFEDFLTRYEIILASLNLDPSRNSRQKVEAFATISGWGKNQMAMGHKCVLLSYSIWKELEDSLRAAEKEERARTKQLKDDDSLVSGVQNRGINTASVTSSADRLMPKSGNANYSSSETGYNEDSQSVVESEDDYQYSKTGGVQDDEGNMWGSEWGSGNGDNYSTTKFNKDVEANKGETKEDIEEIPTTKTRTCWVAFVWLCTWWIPSFLLSCIGKMKRPDVRMAWREKFTLCLLIFLLSAFIIFYIVLFGDLICPNKDKAYRPEQISTHQGDDDFWVSVRGKVYDISRFHKTNHVVGASQYIAGISEMEPFGGKDVTYMFPLPLSQPNVCGTLINNPLIKTDYSVNSTDQVIGAFSHESGVENAKSSALKDPLWYWNTFIPSLKANNGLKADVVYTRKDIAAQAEQGRKWGIINENVYDLTVYFDTAKQNNQYPDRPNNQLPNYRYLDDSVEVSFAKQPGGDYSELFNSKKLDNFIGDPEIKQLNMQCLETVFYVGKIDFTESFKCQFNNYILVVAACVMCAVILVKFLAALQLGARRKPEDHDKFVICQVPCYTEGEDSLKRTMDSLAALVYDDKRKLLFIIADGMIVGSGNDRPTPKIVLDILGVDPKIDPEPLSFKSIGEGMQQLNFGKVYSGLYEYEGHVVPYIVVVKVGKQETERTRPGNRGKRDSQIILMRFLNKVHFDLEMSPLELEIYHQMKNVIGVNPSFYEYILMVDADTEVMPDSLNRMISCMLHDGRIIGICGETTLVNEEGSWTTMIQVYEYYISHHLAKAFESLFGSVTCLPGCFCMYRVRTPTKNTPLIISNSVIDEYSVNHVDTLHKKNLLSLGEDRYLTTLMMKHFPQYKMTFTPDAMCRTAAPDRWSVLLSQRRRWINSTIHNLMELMFLPEMCGFCCFSMRFVVFIDLFGTLILPSTVVYIIYLIWAVVTRRQVLPYVALVMLASVYGLQAIIFILKRQWQHIGWMIIYLLAFPLFSFFIPVYSFWHFDDFSWGNTRVVVGEKGKKQIIITNDEEKFDEKMIPKKKWGDYEQEMLEVDTAESHDSKRSAASGYSYRSRGSGRVGYNDNASQYGGSQYGGGGSVYGGSQHGGGGDYYRDTNLNAPHERRPRSRSPVPRYPPSESNRMSRAYSNSGDDLRNSVILGRDLEYLPPSSRPISSYTVDGFPTDDEILIEIRKILQTANLMSITKKQVREQLSSIFNMDMTPRKEFINNSIELILQGKL